MVAKVKVLIKGKIDLPKNKNYGVGWSTLTLILEEKKIILVDPGTVKNKDIILNALKKEKLSVEDITHVFITHSHVDHYRNVGLFPEATVLDFWGLWKKDKLYFKDWSRDFISFRGNFSKNIQVVKTPGHDESCLTFFINGEVDYRGEVCKGIIGICGDVFWRKNYPKLKDEPFARNKVLLKKSRDFVLKKADYIIPGHDEIYKK